MTLPQPHADLAALSPNPTAYPSVPITTSMAVPFRTQHILLIAFCVQVNLDDTALHARNRYAPAARPARQLLIINLDVGIVYAISQIALFVLGRTHVASAIQGTSTILLLCFVRRWAAVLKDVRYARMQVALIVYKGTRIRMGIAHQFAIDTAVCVLLLIIARFVI